MRDHLLPPTADRDARDRLRASLADGRLAALAERQGLSLVVLFGSAADPAVTDPGDVDLAVAWRPDSERDLLRLVNEMMDLLGDAVDVLDLDRGGPVVRQRALTRGELLLEREPGAFATRQMRAMRDFIETDPLRRTTLEVMSG